MCFRRFYNFVLKYCILILASNKMNKFLKKNNHRYMYIVFIKTSIAVSCHYWTINAVLFQAHVPDFSCLVHRNWSGVALHGPDGHCSRGQQAVQVRLPPLVLASGGKSRPSPSHTSLHAPRLTLHRWAAPETDGVLWETEVDQQYAGQKWTCMYCINFTN